MSTSDEHIDIEQTVEEELMQVEYLLGQIGAAVEAFSVSEAPRGASDVSVLVTMHLLLDQALNLADGLT